jgi:ergothioneine biosynthesis protein EgtB
MQQRSSRPSVRPPAPAAQGSFEARLSETRRLSLELAEPLTPEDMTVQPTDDASPAKWHLAHVTWFFETFILLKHLPGYRAFDPSFNYCFNSYYESQGPRQPRPRRGMLTRPSSEQVLAYRAHVDAALGKLLAGDFDPKGQIARLIEVGINHEQQHQELLLTDILALFAANPLRPAYRAGTQAAARANVAEHADPGWIEFAGGIHEIGHAGQRFAWDNEQPRHQTLVHPFALADRLVTNGEWLAFMADGGYATAALWLADGWNTLNREGWRAPLYWEQRDSAWFQMSLNGMQPVAPADPVHHVSYYEADAFARWADKRLPYEYEWEMAAADLPPTGNTPATRALQPLPAHEPANGRPRQMFGDAWQWTQSAYLPYPGYRPLAGALGEYNGKFMVGQQVLRGSSCVTPPGHSRATYRNFFYPHQRWQFMGLRLASELA